MHSVATPEHWKDRYRDLVTEIEAKERTWASLEVALRHAAVSLGAAALGRDPAVDAKLEAVLEAVKTRAPAEDLGNVLTALAAAVARLGPGPDLQQPGPPQNGPLPAQARSGATLAPDASAAALETFIDRLEAIRPLRSAVAELRRKFGRGAESVEWGRLLGGVADAVAQVIAALQAQRSELEHFLSHVTTQLAQFEAWTEWQDGAAKSRQHDSLDFEHSVQQQMLGMNRDVEEGRELAVIKSKIQSRLDSIATQLKSFRDSEERRREEEESRTSELRNEVVKLKLRTDELAQLVDDQETRLMLDVLTQVHSRYAYELRLEEEYQRWLRYKQPLVYSIWDIDRFKNVNDSYGHDAGDRLLQMIASLLSQHKRSEDFLARVGGEEFVLLLPMTDLAAGRQVADKLRHIVESTRFHHRGKPERVTISCGITEFRDGDTPLTVYNRADEALYEAKQQGRNLCVER